MTLKFFTKKQRAGNFTIVARFYQNGITKDRPTGLTVSSPKEFKDGRIKNNATANNLFTSWINNFNTYIGFCQLEDRMPEIERAIAYVCGEKKMKLTGFTIIDAIDAFIEKKETTHDEKTLIKYTVLKNFLLEYAEYRSANLSKKLSDIRLENLSQSLLEDVTDFSVKVKQNLNSTIKRRHTHIGTILKFAVTQKMATSVPQFDKPMIKVPDTNRVSLKEEELLTLKRFTKVSELDRIKLDAFLFVCETGLRYTDLLNIKPINKINVEGKPAIKFHMDKGGVKLITVPLSLFALNIFNKYAGKQETPLFWELPENPQVYNECLKNIFANAELNRTIESNLKSGNKNEIVMNKLHEVAHVHMGRHTFGTLMIERGVPITAVQKMMGHSKIETTMLYVHHDTAKAVEAARIGLDKVATRLKAV